MSLISRDHSVVWHPFTQRGMAGDPLPVVSAKGAWLELEGGRKILDAISSWWCNTLGHSRPELVQAATEQLKRLDHVIFASCTHEPAVSLAEAIIRHAPNGYGKVFFSDNGSTACEVAIKLAVQLFANRGERGRSRIVALEGAYHGDTFGAMSAGARGLFSAPFEGLLFHVDRLSTEGSEQDRKRLAELCAQGDVAAFIFEPLVQGAGGMRMYPPEVLDGYLETCRRHGVVTIADEVMTGFGRTGPLFASSRLRVAPDVLCLSKGLTGGTMPLALTVVRDALFEEFVSNDHSRTFFHGHTFTGHPVACAVARTALELTASAECSRDRERIFRSHQQFSERLRGFPNAREVRVCGTILALNVAGSGGTGYSSTSTRGAQRFFLERGVLLRPLGDVLYVMPPYCASNDDLGIAYGAIEEFLRSAR